MKHSFWNMIKSGTVVLTFVFASVLPVMAQDCARWANKGSDYWENITPEKIQICVDSGVNINVQDGYKRTPLHFAVFWNKNPEVIMALIDAGADVNAQTAVKDMSESLSSTVFDGPTIEGGYTPLHWAIESNKKSDIVIMLLQAGANVNMLNAYKRTPLHTAIRYNDNFGVINTLLQAGADVNARDIDEYTPLHLLADSNKNSELITIPEELEYLFDDIMPTSSAIDNQNAEVIIALINAGANINARDGYGYTPLHLARKNNKKPEMITVLLNATTDANLRDEDTFTPLHWSIWNNKKLEIITALIKEGADINARAYDGRTSLHLAAGKNKNVELITILLDAGVDVNLRDAKGQTPLHSAAFENENLKIINALFDKGVIPTFFKKWSFFEKRADVNARDYHGRTPLHIAARNNKNPEIIIALLNAGADGKAKDDDGKTAFDLAKENESLKDTNAYWMLGDARF